MATTSLHPPDPIAVVALGGNAITRKGEEGNIQQQFANTRQALPAIVELIQRGYRVVITHGNGPQVGNLFLMVEATHDFIPELPLGVCVADTQGQMGYMIQQSLQNFLRAGGISTPVVTVVTQVVVDRQDPSFDHPTKPIGKFYSPEEAAQIQAEKGYHMVEDSGRGWRIVVPSPKPVKVVEKEVISMLLEHNVIVIAVGGGGIPVIELAENPTDPPDIKHDKQKRAQILGLDLAPEIYDGVDVVIDKDLASAVLANNIGADMLIILTGVDQVCLNFGKPEAKQLDRLTPAQAQRYLAEGHFPPGSMGPKIEAAVSFIENGGKEVLITSLERIREALDGKTGTRLGAETEPLK